MASVRKVRRRHSATAPIRIYTLGTLRIEARGRPVRLPTRANNRPLTLLKVLVALGIESVAVESLCEYLWPDADGDRAIDAFNTTLLRLRRRIGHEALPLVGGRLSLDSRIVWLDVREFRQSLARTADALRAGDLDRGSSALRAALAHYRGAFLEGECDPAPIGRAREFLQDQLIRHVEETVGLLEAAGRIDDVIALCRRGIELHATAETLYRRLMRACLVKERYAEGIELYQRCRTALHTHLVAEPAPETSALYASLLAAAEAPAAPESRDRLDGQPASIAIVPLKELSASLPLQPVLEGLAEDLMTALARDTLLGVVSHKIAARGDVRPEMLRALSRECGIGYVLTGSVQQSHGHLRVHVRLLDTRSGHDIWGERFQGSLERLFELQDEIARCVVEEVDRLLFSGKHFLACRYSSTNPEAARLFLQGQKYAFRRSDPDGTDMALCTVLRALELDADMACAEVVVANLHMEAVENGWSPNSRRDLSRAWDSIERASALRPNLGMVHASRARMLAVRGDYDEAVATAERGLACEAGRADLTFVLARTHLLAGQPDLAVSTAERAMRMTVRREPRHLSWLGAAYLMAGRPAEAVRWLTRATSLMPASPAARLWLAAGHAALGQSAEAHGVAADVHERAPWFDADHWARRGIAFRREGDRQRLLAWLHNAGVDGLPHRPVTSAAAIPMS